METQFDEPVAIPDKSLADRAAAEAYLVDHPDDLTFAANAFHLTRYGIRVFPKLPRSKIPAIKGWPRRATTDAKQIMEWNNQDDERNVAMLADEDYCFLEFDVAGGVKDMCREMGQPTPATRIERSGGGYAHLIFKQTEKSLALGNRHASRDSKEWFAFGCKRKAMTCAGSIHPNGNRYTCVMDVEPTPIPDWVVEYIVKYSEAEIVATWDSDKSKHQLREDFHFEDWCMHYGLEIHQDPSRLHWWIPSVCPVAGHQHEHSVNTGFYYDGLRLGWHCFAGGCDGSRMTVEEVIEWMDERCENGPYPYEIWDSGDVDWVFQSAYKWGGLVVNNYVWDEDDPDMADVTKADEPKSEVKTESPKFSSESTLAMMSLIKEQELMETPEWQYDLDTWDLLHRSDWSAVTTDPEAWGVPKGDVTQEWLDRFVHDDAKQYTRDVKVLAQDLGAATMFRLYRTRNRIDFTEPPECNLTAQEFQKMAA